jgi:hypothetical protein
MSETTTQPVIVLSLGPGDPCPLCGQSDPHKVVVVKGGESYCTRVEEVSR